MSALLVALLAQAFLVGDPGQVQVQPSSSSGSAPAASARYVAPDSNDVLVWTLDEAASPFTSTGTSTGSTFDLTQQAAAGSVPVTGQLGIFNSGVDFPPTLSTYSLRGGAGTITTEPAFPVSVSIWVKFHTYQSAEFFWKGYRPTGSWTSPFVSWGLGSAIGTNGGTATWLFTKPICSFTTGAGVITTITAADAYQLPAETWGHVGCTYDGTTMKLYVNGRLAASSAKAGAIDYGTHGNIIVGGNVDNGAGGLNATVDDARVAIVLRAASYFESVWKGGMNLQ